MLIIVAKSHISSQSSITKALFKEVTTMMPHSTIIDYDLIRVMSEFRESAIQ